MWLPVQYFTILDRALDIELELDLENFRAVSTFGIILAKGIWFSMGAKFSPLERIDLCGLPMVTEESLTIQKS